MTKRRIRRIAVAAHVVTRLDEFRRKNGSDDDRRRAFRQAYATLRRRIELLIALPIDKLEKLELQTRLREIGQVDA